MDVANLIFQPPTDPIESHPIYRPPDFQASSNSRFAPVHFYSQPSEDDQPKCSLPSISTLFESADNAAVQPTKHKRISSPDYCPQPRAYNTSVTSLPVCSPRPISLFPGSEFHCANGHSPSASSVSASSEEGYQNSQIPVTADSSPITIQCSAHVGSCTSTAFSLALHSSAAEYFAPTTVAAPANAISTSTPAALPTTEHQQMISPIFHAEKRNVCCTCQKAFSHSRSLRIHLRSHTGEKPFHCVHAACRKAFSVRSNMTRHARRFHTAKYLNVTAE